MATQVVRLGALITALGTDYKAIIASLATKTKVIPYIFVIDARGVAVNGPTPGVAEVPIGIGGTIINYRIRSTADATAVLDFNKNGTTMFTTQGNRPTLTAGKASTTTLPNSGPRVLADGDYLSVDLDSGSVPIGAVLTGVIYVESS